MLEGVAVAILERVQASLQDVAEALDQEGAEYARAYVGDLFMRRGSPPRPPDLPPQLADLIRQLVLEEAEAVR